MKRNFSTLLAVSILFGLGAGIYEFVLPLYFEQQGIAVSRMGVIYAIGALLIFIARIYAGYLSDLFGRKRLYSIAVAVTAIVNGLTPLSGLIWVQTILKSTYDTGAMIFDSMYQLCLHDDSRTNYANRVARVRGLQALAAAGGTMGAGLLLGRSLYTSAFHIAAASMFVGLAVYLILYRNSNNSTSACDSTRRIALTRILSLDLPRPLAIMASAGFIFTVGLAISHCFVMSLFWKERFGATAPEIGTVLMIHRFTIALPLLFLSWGARRNLKSLFIIFMALEGLSICVAGFIPNFYVAAAIWLTHDLFGAGVWIPVQSALVQRYAREATRGRDFSTVAAFESLGWIFGPLIAGAIFKLSPGGTFIMSGALMMVAAATLSLLPADANNVKQAA